MTEPHLVHRLPWRSLTEVFVDGYPRRTFKAEARHAEQHHKASSATGYAESIITGYLELNLILTDADKFTPLILCEPDQVALFNMERPLGQTDGGHPAWLALHLRPVFDERDRLKSLTPELHQRIRDHCALLFRCMYTLSKRNVFLDVDHIMAAVGCIGPPYWYSARHQCNELGV